MSPASKIRQNPWLYVITGFLTLLFGVSTVNVLINILGKPMAEEFGWARSVVTNGLSIETAVVGVSILVLGVLIDRYGPSVPSVWMALPFGIGMMLLSVVPNNQLVFYLICILIGSGGGAVGAVAHSAVVSAWFQERRGIALGVLVAGLGACGVLMPYLANWVLGIAGWRTTYLVIGALCTIIPVTVYAFITRMPSEHDAVRLAARRVGQVAGDSFATIARTYKQFWLLSVAILLVSSATWGLMAQIVPMTTDKGIEQGTAVSILAMLSLSSIGARLVVGYLLDYFPARFVGTFIFLLAAIGVFLVIGSSATGLIFLGAILIGVALGAETDLAAYMVSRYFPQHSYGRVVAFIYFMYSLGSSLGIFLLGQIFSATGSYSAGVLPIIGMVAASVVCLLLMGPYKFSLNYREIGASTPVAEDKESRSLAESTATQSVAHPTTKSKGRS
ncbi:MFS transporter [Rhodococcus sp. MSC1_016]|jgi:MFS family permease|uniref:MFS transporter n=1 Tax=Rhodococcus sp. MSC1_016 TaxID=2909266 RepID=UPI00202EAC66|nr:MFS transporter [Rhodococcus sp. MSC1_016]